MQGRSIETTPFYYTDENLNPLFLGCSGGGGHNSAIEAIIKRLVILGLIKLDQLPSYTPRLAGENVSEPGNRNAINIALKLTHEYQLFSPSVQWALKKS